MSALVAIAYPDQETAETVRQELIQATKEHLLQLDDAVVVVHQPELLERITPYGGHVVQTSLTTEDEERLRSALETTPA